MKETTPMLTEATQRSRKSSGSTSAPAKKVRTIEAKVAMKTSQLVSGSTLNRLPTTTPSPSSISATESPTSTEMMLARTTVAASTAATCVGSMKKTSTRVVDVGRGH